MCFEKMQLIKMILLILKYYDYKRKYQILICKSLSSTSCTKYNTMLIVLITIIYETEVSKMAFLEFILALYQHWQTWVDCNHEYHNFLKSTKYRFGSSSSSSDIFSSLNLYENAFSTAPFRRYCLLQFTTYTKQKFIYCVVFFFYNQTAHEMQRTNEAAPCSKQCA